MRCFISDCYDKHQFHGLSLKDIPKPGMPGMAYVMTAPDAIWPANLTVQ